MSGPKGTVHRSVAEVSAAVYRAAQREAARVEAERRAREQQHRRALAAARERIVTAQRSYFEIVSRVDEARHGLPDFACANFVLPALPTSDDVAAWDSCAVHSETGLAAWQARVEDAIRDAQTLLRRREALRAAWARHHELGEDCAALAEDLAELCSSLDETCAPWAAPARPAASSAVDVVERANADLESTAARMREQIGRYRAIAEANDALRRAIDRVAVRHELISAEDAVAHWRGTSHDARVRAFETRLRENLRELGVTESDLPARLRAALAEVRHGRISPESAGIWAGIERHAEQARQRECAAMLLDNPPFIEDDDLAGAWRSITCDLERVVNGLDELTATMQRSCESLHAESKRRMASRYTRAAIMLALEESGFVPVERDDIQFDDANGERTVLGLQGFPQHRVLLDTRDDGLLWMPFRTDDAADAASSVRDAEFDDAACTRLRQALDCVNEPGRRVIGEVMPLTKPGERQIQLASDMERLDIRVAGRGQSRQALKQKFRDPTRP